MGAVVEMDRGAGDVRVNRRNDERGRQDRVNDVRSEEAMVSDVVPRVYGSVETRDSQVLKMDSLVVREREYSRSFLYQSDGHDSIRMTSETVTTTKRRGIKLTVWSPPCPHVASTICWSLVR